MRPDQTGLLQTLRSVVSVLLFFILATGVTYMALSLAIAIIARFTP